MLRVWGFGFAVGLRVQRFLDMRRARVDVQRSAFQSVGMWSLGMLCQASERWVNASDPVGTELHGLDG